MIINAKLSAKNMVCVVVTLENFLVNNTMILMFRLSLEIKEKSILFELQSTRFPQSFPVDMMHLFFENIAKDIYNHWRGLFFKDNSENQNEYTVNAATWNHIGQSMQINRRHVPTSFGRPPRNIISHSAGYKAEEWSRWISLYSIPLLKDHIDEKYLAFWHKFVEAANLCKKWTITKTEVETVRRLLIEFYNHYERYIFKTIVICFISVHNLFIISFFLVNIGKSRKNDCLPC